MPQVTGTIVIDATPSSLSLVVRVPGPPVAEVAFPNPDPWVRERVDGREGKQITVTYTELPGPPPSTTITGVRVG